MYIKSKTEAQERADQIGSFKAELKIIEQEEIISLTDNQRTELENYHNSLMERLATSFDIDSNMREKQLSLGMKIASFLGALGLAASVFFLFYQFWGLFSTSLQVLILTGSPVLSLAVTMYVSNREKTGYFTKLLGLVTFACFVLNLTMLGAIFNITPSENAFFAWALFAFLLAYASDTRLLLVAGIISFSGFLSAKTGTLGGCYWLNFGERPENFFLPAFIIFFLSYLPHRKFSGFNVIYRVFGMLILLIPVLILANWGAGSYLFFPKDTIEAIYQTSGFIISALAIWVGIKKSWPDVVNTGNVFFTVFLYTKFFDWWWDWMPKYIFFLIIGLTAILVLLVFKRLRNSVYNNSGEVTS